MDSLSKFFGAKTRIIRDGSGAYMYRATKSDLGQYHDGQRVQPRKEVYSIRPQFDPFRR